MLDAEQAPPLSSTLERPRRPFAPATPHVALRRADAARGEPARARHPCLRAPKPKRPSHRGHGPLGGTANRLANECPDGACEKRDASGGSAARLLAGGLPHACSPAPGASSTAAMACSAWKQVPIGAIGIACRHRRSADCMLWSAQPLGTIPTGPPARARVHALILLPRSRGATMDVCGDQEQCQKQSAPRGDSSEMGHNCEAQRTNDFISLRCPPKARESATPQQRWGGQAGLAWTPPPWPPPARLAVAAHRQQHRLAVVPERRRGALRAGRVAARWPHGEGWPEGRRSPESPRAASMRRDVTSTAEGPHASRRIEPPEHPRTHARIYPHTHTRPSPAPHKRTCGPILTKDTLAC